MPRHRRAHWQNDRRERIRNAAIPATWEGSEFAALPDAAGVRLAASQGGSRRRNKPLSPKPKSIPRDRTNRIASRRPRPPKHATARADPSTKATADFVEGRSTAAARRAAAAANDRWLGAASVGRVPNAIPGFALGPATVPLSRAIPTPEPPSKKDTAAACSTIRLPKSICKWNSGWQTVGTFEQCEVGLGVASRIIETIQERNTMLAFEFTRPFGLTRRSWTLRRSGLAKA